MSLIKCTECGKEFSVKADHCPNCGCPTWDIINELYKADQSININHEVYDISEILSNIETGVDDQISIDAIANSAEISASAAYCILQEIKEGNFLPWTEGGYGTLTNIKKKLIKEMSKLQSNKKRCLIAQIVKVQILKELNQVHVYWVV